MPKPNYGAGAAGAVTGAGTGFGIAGPPGAVVGGIIGGAAGLFGGGAGKSKKQKKPKKMSTLDPSQQRLYKDYINSIRGKGKFSDLYNFDAEGYNDTFDQTIGRPAYRKFNEEIIPGITGSFRQNNLQNSSYAGEALSRAGRDVQESLDAQRSANIFQGQQQANANKQNAIQNVLGINTFDYSKPASQNPSTIDQILSSLGPDAARTVADMFKNRGTAGTAQPTQAPTQQGQLPQTIYA